MNKNVLIAGAAAATIAGLAFATRKRSRFGEFTEDSAEIVKILDSRHDGPIGAFAVIDRAIEMAYHQEFPIDSISNTLHDYLKDAGWLKNTDKLLTGSGS